MSVFCTVKVPGKLSYGTSTSRFRHKGEGKEAVACGLFWPDCGAKTGGDPNQANLRSQEYNPDFLNRYTSRTVSRYVQSIGTANSSAPVWLWSINGLNTLTSRKGTYFWGELFLNNNNALYAPLTNIAILNSGQYLGREVRTNWLPATPEIFGYDLDGNLTSDGRWNYTWDAENRLIRLVANNAVAPQQRIDFEYDWQGRRISKKVWNNTAGSGNPVTHLKFVYDGWNLLAEIDGLNPQPRTLIRSYVWGTDLSGSLQGAGGVGGLLKFIYHGTQSTNFVTYDGNGNVAALFDVSNNALLASYEYGPFGELTCATGPTVGSMAKLNPIRFSTKYQDDETDLLYYGYRYYSANTGRWLSRDPLEEDGGLNLYGFVGNSPQNSIDVDGRSPLLVAILARVLWDGACGAWALSKAGSYFPPNDPNEYKRHCYVGCLTSKCSLVSPETMGVQVMHEIYRAIKQHGLNPANWPWQEMIKDTAATLDGMGHGLKFIFGDCAKDCDKPCRNS